MSINFRLAYNQGVNYIDLFPKTNMEAIINNENGLSYSLINNITIPAVSQGTNTQTISINATASQNDSPFYVFLSSSGQQAQLDYQTINQNAV